MSNIKKLASQTVYYGLSSIAARFINYLLTPYLTAVLTKQDYGKMGAIYSMIPLFNILFTYGMETAYFRFIQKKERVASINSTITISMLCSTVLLFALTWYSQTALASIASLKEFPQLIQLSIIIMALDALSTIPFARLRNEGRPLLFAFIKIAGIVINILATIFFLSYCNTFIAAHPNSLLNLVYNPADSPIKYILIANIMQSAFTLLFLSKWMLPEKWAFDVALWKEMMLYALPMLVAGLGGMINETFDRLMLGWWLPITYDFDEQRGIYNACYKLSILITLFIQAFRMGAEPFFFKQAEGDNPQKVYARVMKFFVIVISMMFLVVSLYIPIWKHFIASKHWVGLDVVPILLLANMFLGIYYNLSIWYKVSNKTRAGAYITLVGTAITIIINFLFIPHFSYMACAWATFCCYGSMMIMSFVWGQKAYYIPYAWKKLVAYIVIVVALFFIHKGAMFLWGNTWFGLLVAALLTYAYGWFIFLVERKEFKKLPVVGKWVK
ncbi:oligosaccharide flippase family protein [Parasediminibacterium sp. JCM 36343]|uniref:oligosaccharide flippase family protein n=1 Tax=Parasediminibacterium sp. JCM 36343 TaxID=3374279 RepID=UPI00397ACD60